MEKLSICRGVTSCSDDPSDAVLLIKEVEMIDFWTIYNPRDQFMDFPKFEMLDAKIASVLNNIIQNCHFKKKVSLEEQKAKKRIDFYEENRSLSSDWRSMYNVRLC